jgi:hypothetical protein
MGKNVEKKMEKVENPFSSDPFFQGSRNLILFSGINPSKNKIFHKKLSSTPVCCSLILSEVRSEDRGTGLKE